jgi:hypothetical protein
MIGQREGSVLEDGSYGQPVEGKDPAGLARIIKLKNDGTVEIDGTVVATPSGTQDVDVVANTIGLATEATLGGRLADATFTGRVLRRLWCCLATRPPSPSPRP